MPNVESGSDPGDAVSSLAAPGDATHSFWNDAYGPLPLESRAHDLTLMLIHLENRLLKQQIRLQRTEWRLSKLVSRKRGGSGRRAARQIERERQRLSRELHTGVGQLLAAIRMQLEVAETELPNSPPAVRQALERVGTLAAEALEQVRSVSRRLHPPEWQRFPIGTALQHLWEMTGASQRFAGGVHLQETGPDPDPDVKTLLYRAAQEALANVIRHSQATRIDVSLERREGRLVLTVQDNGVGFDAAQILYSTPDPAAGIGLRSIREHALNLGGKLSVHSSTLGTTLEVAVPLPG